MAGGELATQLDDFARRLRDVDIDRVQPLDRGQGGGLAWGDQGALGDAGDADAARDRRGDGGPAQVDASGVRRRVLLFDRGRRLPPGGLGVVIVLLADPVNLDQVGVAFRLEAGGGQVGFGAGDLRLGLVVGGLERGWVDPVKHLAGLDLAPLGERAGDDDASDLRADVRDFIGSGAARQLAGPRDRLGLQSHHADRRRALIGHPALAGPDAAAGDGEHDDQRAKGREGCWS